MIRLLRSRDPRMLRWGRLGLWVLAVTGLWGVFQLHSSTSSEDSWLLLSISAVYSLAILVMLKGTEEWTARNLGLLSTITADALLYGLGGMAARRWINPASEREVDLIRTFFVIGGVLLLIGLLRWIRDRWQDGRDDNGPSDPRKRALVEAALIFLKFGVICTAAICGWWLGMHLIVSWR